MLVFEQEKSFEEYLAEWRGYADQLAEWAERRLLNRTDAYVRYLPLEERVDGRKLWTEKRRVQRQQLVRHFQGADVGDLVALHSTSAAGGCRWVAVDVDCHEDNEELRQRNWEFIVAVMRRVVPHGFVPLVLDSDGRGGLHLLLIFSEPVPSRTAYRFGKWMTQDWRAFGIPEPETFPKQPTLSGQKYGSALRLPGRHHTRPHLTKVFNPYGWHAGGEAARWLLKTPLHLPRFVPVEARNYQTPQEQQRQRLAQMSAHLPKRPTSVRPVLSNVETYRRVRHYLMRSGPSIEGQRGDDHLWRLIWCIRKTFSLPVEEAYPLFLEWNSGCQPPFSPEYVWKQMLRVWSRAA